jgi:hypothetical protein
MGRRGRKSTAGKREPNGQLSRKPKDVVERVLAAVDRDERDALSVGLAARVRVHGITAEMLDGIPCAKDELPLTPAQFARDQMAGSFVGRLCMQRVISRIQYEAAITYAVEREAYLRAVAPAQGSVARAVNLNATHGSSNYENETKTRQDVARYRAAYAAIIEAWRELRGQGKLLAAIQRLVIEDEPFEALVPDLRTALNALAKHYGLSGNTRKAA